MIRFRFDYDPTIPTLASQLLDIRSDRLMLVQFLTA